MRVEVDEKTGESSISGPIGGANEMNHESNGRLPMCQHRNGPASPGCVNGLSGPAGRLRRFGLWVGKKGLACLLGASELSSTAVVGFAYFKVSSELMRRRRLSDSLTQ
jgi:hypothetical protein